MNTSETSSLLQESDNPFISLTLSKIKPQLRMRKVLRTEKNKNLRQMSKRKSSTLDKLTLYDEDYGLLLLEQKNDLINQVSQISKLKVNLKKLKSLKHLDINLNWIMRFCPQGFCEFFESLKHLKGLSVVHFSSIGPIFFWKFSPERTQYFSQWIHQFPNTEFKLSLEIKNAFSPKLLDNVERFIKSLSEHENFTSACLKFSYVDSELIQRFISSFKESKYLAKLSLTLQGGPRELERFFLDLTEIKLSKHLIITFQSENPSYFEMKKCLPLLKKIAENSHLNIFFESPHLSMGDFCWWLFKRSIKKIHSSHTIHVEDLGQEKTGFIGSFHQLPKGLKIYLLFLILLILIQVGVYIFVGFNSKRNNN